MERHCPLQISVTFMFDLFHWFAVFFETSHHFLDAEQLLALRLIAEEVLRE